MIRYMNGFAHPEGSLKFSSSMLVEYIEVCVFTDVNVKNR